MSQNAKIRDEVEVGDVVRVIAADAEITAEVETVNWPNGEVWMSPSGEPDRYVVVDGSLRRWKLGATDLGCVESVTVVE